MNQKELFLTLEDGTIFQGINFGYYANSDGEVVFNTGMTGYENTLTDPSYRGQILTMTYPLIGNYGVPAKDKDEFVINIDIKNIVMVYHFLQKHTVKGLSSEF
jgi:carbamoylphosphate synthase small subunit